MRTCKRSYYLIQCKLVSNESAIEAQIASRNSFLWGGRKDNYYVRSPNHDAFD